MRYLIKEKIFSLANKFTIKDELGSSHFNVEGKIFSIGKKLSFYDMEGKLLLQIEEKLFRFLSEYHIIRDGKLLGKVNKKLSLLRPKYDIDSIYGRYTIDGNILHHDFNIYKNGSPVAWIGKKYISLSDSYTVDIDDGEDQAFILALVIVLDQIHYDGSNVNNNTSNQNS